jgi:hypothetical protein
MSDTVWVAAIAVFGTAVGAAVGPVIGLFKESRSSRGNQQSERIRAVAQFGTALLAFARVDPGHYDSMQVRHAHNTAIERRFELARHIPKGAGAVDRFAEDTIAEVAAHGSGPARIYGAEYAASTLLAWARGDLRASKLEKFTVEPNGPDDFLIL